MYSEENTFARHLKNKVVEQDKMEETGNDYRSSRLSFISNWKIGDVEQKTITPEDERS